MLSVVKRRRPKGPVDDSQAPKVGPGTWGVPQRSGKRRDSACASANTHTHARAHTHAHTHTHSHTHTHVCMHTHMHARAHAISYALVTWHHCSIMSLRKLCHTCAPAHVSIPRGCTDKHSYVCAILCVHERALVQLLRA